MRKTVSVILAAVILLFAVSFALAEDISGKWYADFSGIVMILDLQQDGTGSMSMGTDSLGDFSWSVEGDTFYINRGQEDETTLSIAPGRLFDEAEGVEFTRNVIEAATVPVGVKAADISEFNGTWELSHVSAYGAFLDAKKAMEELGESMGISDTTAVIQDGKASLLGSGELEFAFEDGILVNKLLASDDSSLTQTISLTEDGSLAYEMMGLGFYFTKAE